MFWVDVDGQLFRQRVFQVLLGCRTEIGQQAATEFFAGTCKFEHSPEIR